MTMETNRIEVAICMATYNGEKYIAEQIESILSQTYRDWALFIRDDNSRDRTPQIIDGYEKEYPQRIHVIKSSEIEGGSSKKNFAGILKWVTDHYNFSYFMFSDQDDVWLENKIDLTINKMRDVEKSFNGPVLIHTDLRVVNSNLDTLGNSFFKYRALNPCAKQLNRLLVQNNITGCTMLWNKKLNDLVNLQSDCVAMHDWWIALVACCFGQIDFLEAQTILYRQHGGNVVGATNVNSFGFIIKRLMECNHIKETFNLAFDQAQEFYNYYTNQAMLDESQRHLLKEFYNMKNTSKRRKVKCIIRNRFYKQGIVQILGEMLFI